MCCQEKIAVWSSVADLYGRAHQITGSQLSPWEFRAWPWEEGHRAVMFQEQEESVARVRKGQVGGACWWIQCSLKNPAKGHSFFMFGCPEKRKPRQLLTLGIIWLQGTEILSYLKFEKFSWKKIGTSHWPPVAKSQPTFSPCSFLSLSPPPCVCWWLFTSLCSCVHSPDAFVNFEATLDETREPTSPILSF